MLLPFDELDNIIAKFRMPFFEIHEETKDEVIDEIYELLVLSLVYGIDNVNGWLDVKVELPIETTESILFKPIDGMTWDERISMYIDTAEDGKVIVGGQQTDLTDAILKVAETETTRVFGESEQAAAEQAEEEEAKRATEPSEPSAPTAPGEGEIAPTPLTPPFVPTAPKGPRKTVKTWRTKKDERVRDTHRFLEGVTIPIDQRFWTIDGDSAMTPGGFATAQENVNCRCFLVYSWA